MNMCGPVRRAMASAVTAAALCCVAGAAAAQQPAPAQSTPARPATNPVSPQSIQALKDMGAFLQTLRRYQATVETTGERVLVDGQKLQHTATATVDVSNPNKLRVRVVSPRSERELMFDGKNATLFTPAQKYYSTVEFAGTIKEFVRMLEEKYGVDVPLTDMFLWGTPAAPVDQIQSGMNAGQDFVGDDLCDHYAFRQGEFDWQIWIMVGDKPLPRKVVITNRADEARPQSVSLIEWNLKPTFKDSSFTFSPPKGARKVDIVQAKTQ